MAEEEREVPSDQLAVIREDAQRPTLNIEMKRMAGRRLAAVRRLTGGGLGNLLLRTRGSAALRNCNSMLKIEALHTVRDLNAPDLAWTIDLQAGAILGQIPMAQLV